MPSASAASSEQGEGARQYGRYQLIKKLAAGGMAEVYLARQTGMEGFEKLLVVKRILPHLADDEEFVQMFLNEARIAARFNHPNIVQIYDLGKADGTYYIGMEYIHGEDLGRIMRKAWNAGRWIDMQLSLRVIAQACEGLYYAHTKTDDTGRPLGVVHRDISPQNILVSFDGGVKVVDFGIAKAGDSATSTKSGTIKGKYAYMSPEQAAGKTPDQRTDVFALGLVLYELLTGVRPLKRESDIQTLQAALSCEIEPPSKVAAVAEELDPLVMGALTADVNARYQSAREFQLAIEDHLVQHHLSASSIHLSEFMRELFAERLAEEAKQGRPVPSISSQSLPSIPSIPASVVSEPKSRRRNSEPENLPTTPVKVPTDLDDDYPPKKSPSRKSLPAMPAAPRTRSVIEQPVIGSEDDDEESTSLDGEPVRKERSGPLPRRTASSTSMEAAAPKRKTGEIRAQTAGPSKIAQKLTKSDPGGMPQAPSRRASSTAIPRSEAWKEALRPASEADAEEAPPKRGIGGILFLLVLVLGGGGAAFVFKDQLLALAHPGPAPNPEAKPTPGTSLPFVKITTVPEGMNVFVEGHLEGQTPYTYEPAKAGQVQIRIALDREGLEREFAVAIREGDPPVYRTESFVTGPIKVKFDREDIEGDVFLGNANVGHIPGPPLRLGEGKHELVVKNVALGLNVKVPVTVVKNRTTFVTVPTKSKAAPVTEEGDDSSAN